MQKPTVKHYPFQNTPWRSFLHITLDLRMAYRAPDSLKSTVKPLMGGTKPLPMASASRKHVVANRADPAATLGAKPTLTLGHGDPQRNQGHRPLSVQPNRPLQTESSRSSSLSSSSSSSSSLQPMQSAEITRRNATQTEMQHVLQPTPRTVNNAADMQQSVQPNQMTEMQRNAIQKKETWKKIQETGSAHPAASSSGPVQRSSPNDFYRNELQVPDSHHQPQGERRGAGMESDAWSQPQQQRALQAKSPDFELNDGHAALSARAPPVSGAGGSGSAGSGRGMGGSRGPGAQCEGRVEGRAVPEAVPEEVPEAVPEAGRQREAEDKDRLVAELRARAAQLEEDLFDMRVSAATVGTEAGDGRRERV